MKGTCRSIILHPELEKTLKKLKSNAKTNDYKPGFRTLEFSV